MTEVIMSRFFNSIYKDIVPYTPGERPSDKKYIKLNTNESPYAPAPGVITAMQAEAAGLNLYNDPGCNDFLKAAADYHGLTPDYIFAGNGADEVLQYALLAFFGQGTKGVCSDITYPYYKGYFQSFGLEHSLLPLNDDFSINVEDFASADENVILVNPNAPTGLCLPINEVEKIVAANKDRIVLVDEAYVDYGGESCLPLVKKYDNLLVVRTFSKSRNLAGGRIGYAVGDPTLIGDMNTLKAVINPYNLNTMAQAGGIASFADEAYFRTCVDKVIAAREMFTEGLRELGFRVLDSKANFVFACHEKKQGGDLYRQLKAEGVLVRYYNAPRIDNWIRVSIGTMDDMKAVLDILKKILA